MNILITLPKELISAIVEGRKTIEFRKNYPRQFDVTKDVVYIVEKGTKSVVAAFTISRFEVAFNPMEIWDKYSDDLCVPFSWFREYAPICREYWIWHIKDAWRFKYYYHRGVYFGVASNPQSFVYLDNYLKYAPHLFPLVL